MVLFHINPNLFEPKCQKEECLQCLADIRKTVLQYEYPYLRKCRKIQDITRLETGKDYLRMRSGKNFISFMVEELKGKEE